MPFNAINRGQFPGDASGEVTYTSWGKANAMFLELFDLISLIDTYPFVKVGESFIKKEGTNVTRIELEIGDTILWREISNNGDPIVLMGHTYIGGDQELETSYELTKVIST